MWLGPAVAVELSQVHQAFFQRAAQRFFDQVLCQDSAAVLPASSPPAQRKASALHAWALVHGLAKIELDNQVGLDHQIPADWALLERVLSGFAALLQPPPDCTASLKT